MAATPPVWLGTGWIRPVFHDESLPAATLVYVSALAHPGYLLEVEAIAVVPRPD